MHDTNDFIIRSLNFYYFITEEKKKNCRIINAHCFLVTSMLQLNQATYSRRGKKKSERTAELADVLEVDAAPGVRVALGKADLPSHRQPEHLGGAEAVARLDEFVKLARKVRRLIQCLRGGQHKNSASLRYIAIKREDAHTLGAR